MMTLTRTKAAAQTAPSPPANDACPFEGEGAGDWGDQWLDRKLRALYQADEQTSPTPRLAELMRRLEESLARDRQA